MKFVIIDGYNLIFQCGLEGHSADERALQRARERLFRELTAALDLKGLRLCLTPKNGPQASIQISSRSGK